MYVLLIIYVPTYAICIKYHIFIYLFRLITFLGYFRNKFQFNLTLTDTFDGPVIVRYRQV